MWSYYKGLPLTSYTTWKKSHLSWVCILPTHRTSKLTIENAEEHRYPQLKSTVCENTYNCMISTNSPLFKKRHFHLLYWVTGEPSKKERNE